MKLIPISEHPDAAKILYDLLEERTLEQSISHSKMPTWEGHLAFVERMKPSHLTVYDEIRLGEPRYQGWFLIETGRAIVGAIYLTSQRNEIGVSIFKKYQMLGFGNDAVVFLMQKYGPAKYFANVAPTNEPSRKMFEKLGFKKIQETFALEAE